MTHSNSACQNFIALARTFKRAQATDSLTQCLVPRLSRSYATHTELPAADTTSRTIRKDSPQVLTSATPQPILTTLYSWPAMEPTSFKHYEAHKLGLPLRKDILHRAVVYEGDNTRQGSASAKHRTQVAGSGRKVRPQKGTGNARLSDRKSPSIRGGGVAHGPHPRDFGTELPKKIYDLAWRTALSYRYMKGELIILENKIDLAADRTPRWLNNFFVTNCWGKGNGRSLVVRHPTTKPDEKEAEARLIEGMSQIEEHAKVRNTESVDVKDLLSCGRVIIEEKALASILNYRS